MFGPVRHGGGGGGGLLPGPPIVCGGEADLRRGGGEWEREYVVSVK